MRTDTGLHDRFARLVDHAWDLYAAEAERPGGSLVRPSMPILFFGDLAAYLSSPIRIITVGLNPSGREFPAGRPWLRFPTMEGFDAVTRRPETSAYLSSLSGYFKNAPYRSWFESLEPVLNGFGSSFYRGGAGVALHTDLCSPLPTSPTWSRLSAEVASSLSADGTVLWRVLADTLAPDLVVVSLARRHRDRIVQGGQWEEAYRLERRRPYVAELAVTRLWSREVPVLFGPAAQLPFGTLAKADKRELGARVGHELDLTVPSHADDAPNSLAHPVGP
jgi:hypothetical protein